MQYNSFMRIIGIDYGSKRVGLALSDEAGKFALPISVLANKPGLVMEIVKLAEANEAKEIVIGESKNYKGEANPIMTAALEFKKRLENLGFTVHLEPEFLTSAQAERIQGKHPKLDASAAALILQAYLDKIDSNTANAK